MSDARDMLDALGGAKIEQIKDADMAHIYTEVATRIASDMLQREKVPWKNALGDEETVQGILLLQKAVMDTGDYNKIFHWIAMFNNVWGVDDTDERHLADEVYDYEAMLRACFASTQSSEAPTGDWSVFEQHIGIIAFTWMHTYCFFHDDDFFSRPEMTEQWQKNDWQKRVAVHTHNLFVRQRDITRRIIIDYVKDDMENYSTYLYFMGRQYEKYNNMYDLDAIIDYFDSALTAARK